MLGATIVIVVSEYRGHRIEIDAVAVNGRFNAQIRIRPLFSQKNPRVETVTCFKLTAEHAERSGEIWARRWIAI